jgi:hypothetical protein
MAALADMAGRSVFEALAPASSSRDPGIIKGVGYEPSRISEEPRGVV